MIDSQSITVFADDLSGAIAEIADVESAETVAIVMDKIRLFEEQARRLKSELTAALIQWIKIHGPLTIGTIRWYVGKKKKTTCPDQGKALQMFLDLGGVSLVRDLLSSGAFKHGESRKRLEEIGSPELYAMLFETVEEETLVDGKPAKVDALLSADSRFAR